MSISPLNYSFTPINSLYNPRGKELPNSSSSNEVHSLTSLSNQFKLHQKSCKLIDWIFANKSLWMEILEYTKGSWFYKMNQHHFYKAIEAPCCTFLKDNPAWCDMNGNSSTSCAFTLFLSLIPWDNFTDSLQITSEATTISCRGYYNKLPAELEETLSAFKGFPSLKELIPTLIELKILELKALAAEGIRHDAPSTGVKNIPCLVITEANRSGEAFNAVFYNDQFLGLTEDNSTLKEFEKNGFLIKIKIENDKGQKMGVFSLEHLQAIKDHLSASTSKIPPFLLIKASPPPTPDQTAPEKIAKGGTKRPFWMDSEDDHPPKKRRKTEAAPELSVPPKALSPLTVPMPQIAGEPSPYPDHFWKNLTFTAVEKISNKLKARESRKSIFQETPHVYPILNLIRQPGAELPFSQLHPLLKPYQAKEVETQLSFFQKGVSRLLSFEMGLGKTYVLAEILAQLIYKGLNGTALFVAPQTVTAQMTDELRNYMGVVGSIAWAHRFHQAGNAEQTSVLSEGMKLIAEAFDQNSPETLFSVLPLFSYIPPSELYNLLQQKEAFDPSKSSFWEKVQLMADKLIRSLQNSAPLEMGAVSSSLFDQLLRSSQLICRCYEQNGITIPHLEHNPQALLNLTQFPPYRIRIADTINAIKEQLQKGNGALVTHFEAFAKIPEKLMGESPIGALFIDEAQKIHNSKADRSISFLKLTSAAKKKNPLLPLLLSTGTPFENNFPELWALLKIGNPLSNSFEKRTLDLLQNRMALLQKALAAAISQQEEDTSDEEGISSEDLTECLILTFSHLEAFRQKVLTSLLARKDREDPEVKESWQNRTPQTRHLIIDAKLTDRAREALKAAHRDFEGSSFGFLTYRHKTQLLLLHPRFKNSSFDGRDRKIAKAERLLRKKHSLNKKMRWIRNSPLVCNLVDSEPFKEMVKNHQNGLVFADHLKTASLLKLALEALSTNSEPVHAALFSGEQAPQERENTLKWFKTPENGTKILVTMKKIGSAGLNLPEASYVFFPSGDDFNPSVDNQAAARAVRINSTGLKTIVSFQYDIFLHYHAQAIRDVKKSMGKFFNVDASIGIGEQFATFTRLLSAQFHHALLKQSKNYGNALELKQSFEEQLDLLTENIDDETLKASLQSALPG